MDVTPLFMNDIMKPKHIRLIALSISVLALAGMAFLGLFYSQDSLLYYTKPSEAQDHRPGRSYRMGGLVTDWQDHGQRHVFTLSDKGAHMVVHYNGLVPDLFQVGQGAIVDGAFGAKGIFVATRVLAKHDENYQPPESP
jgi:cytochrome c-type biogenesis protein CcmE